MVVAAALEQGLRWTILACAAYLALVFVIDLFFLVFAALETIRRSRQRRVESLEALRASRFTLPVSVIVPVHNEEPVAVPVVRSLLALDYPEFEVVVVNDGSTDGTLAALKSEFELEPRAAFVRQVFSRGEDPIVYRSASDPRLVVVDRAVSGGSKATALNYGLDACRYPWICAVDGDTIYDPDALLRTMAPVHRDPRVVGVTSRIGVAVHPERHRVGTPDRRGPIDEGLLCDFQHVEYLRAFINDRLAWSRLGFMLCASGAFMLWRRDLLDEVGGFSPSFSCEDIEITFRVHERLLREGRSYKILALPEKVATTEVPEGLAGLVAQRARWQRVTLETVWHYRRMLFNPRYGPVGLIGVPFFVISEVMASLFEVVGLTTLVAALWLGVFSWQDYVVFLALIALANGVLTTAAIWLEDAVYHTYRLRQLLRFTLLGPLEIVVYRPIILWARLKGTVGFLRRDRRWGKFERNARSPDAGAVTDECGRGIAAA